MGANLSNKRTESRRRRHNSEINITPFVDVMLVLLIVFMVVAPMMTVGVNVNLPEKNAPSIETKKEPLTITIKKTGSIYLQNTLVNKKQLLARMKIIYKNTPNIIIFIRGDNNVAYGNIMDTMADLAYIGFKKVSLITKQKN